MKKVGLCLLTAVLCVCFISMTNAEGVKVGGQADSAKEITITGGIDLLTVYRDTGITSILDCTDKTSSEGYITPLLTLNFNADLGEKVSGYLRLENTQLQGGVGTAEPGSYLGYGNNQPTFKQAYVKVSEFIDQKLTLVIGQQDLKYTLRKGEGAFFMDVAGSEPFCAGMNGLFQWFAPGTNTSGEGLGGLKLAYGNVDKDNYAVDFFYGTILETGVAHNDEELKGFHVDYKLPGENNYLQVILASMKFYPASFYTIGAGVDYQAMPNLETYGEVYMQTGDWAPKCTQNAMAMRFGGCYKLEHELKPYVGLSYWSVGGDKITTAKKHEDFISYENVQSTMIMEDQLSGLDLDANYTAIKVDAGITTSLDINKDGKGEEVNVTLLLGMFNAINVPSGWDDALGTEIDVKATLKYTPSLSFTLGLGMVSGAKFFEEATGYNMTETSMTMVTLDTKVTF
jgi:hypothetical protein